MQNLKEQLQELIQKQPNNYSRSLKSNAALMSAIDPFPGLTISEKVYNFLNDFTSNQKYCLLCSNEISKPFISPSKGYRSYCSGKCASSHGAQTGKTMTGFRSEESKQKRKETLIERYGTDSIISLNRDKAIETTREKYGVDYAFQSKEVRDKRDQSVKEVHGVDNVFQLESIKSKIKETLLKNHGVEHALQSKEILEKQQETMIERHGAKSPLESDSLVEKIKSTNLERYGFENAMQAEEISRKVSQTQRKEIVDSGRFSSKVSTLESRYSTILQTSADDYVLGKPLRWKHSCGKEYESHWGNGFISVCPELDCRKISAPQRAIHEYVQSLIPTEEVRSNDRATIKPLELDIYVPGRSFAIEVDGVYWHQDDLDSIKLKLCEAQGIRLLHITDLSWFQSEDIWKSIIRTKLGLNQRIFARSCKIVELWPDQERKFFEDNHLQGYAPSRTCYGLLHDKELVAAMSFSKPRFSDKADWELLRFASKLEVTVVGGASRLLSKFEADFSPKNLLTYANKNHSTGELYKLLGFRLTSLGTASYFYLKNGQILSRYQAQKHKLPEILGDSFDESLSEKENMLANGWLRIPDRGSSTHIKEYSCNII